MLNRFTHPRVPVFAVAVLLPLSALTAAQTASSVLDAVQKAAPQRIDGPIPAHVSGGAEQRAKELQAMLGGSRRVP